MTLPNDYDPSDGFNDSKGCEQCPHCNRIYSSNGGYIGPVYDQQGTRYEFWHDTNPSESPFFCPDCWEELDANRKREENESLTEWSE